MKKTNYLRFTFAVMMAGAAMFALGSCSKDDPVNLKTNLRFTAGSVTFELIYVEGGSFTVGATPEQGDDAQDREKPAHVVTLTDDYYMGKFEVTQQLWQAVTGKSINDQRNLANPSEWLYGEGDNYPMYYISYEDCVSFCTALNTLVAGQLPAGYEFRLSTEAQWEYAARGGKKSVHYKYSGSNDANAVAWYSDNSGSTTHEVGKKLPNELGIYDMSGNMWEWCKDRYGDYNDGVQTNPQGPASGSFRVLRGGVWYLNAQYCRIAIRNFNLPSYRSEYYGFRLALVKGN
jgi:formylglycine-generating enzyme required for sulfatase activity